MDPTRLNDDALGLNRLKDDALGVNRLKDDVAAPEADETNRPTLTIGVFIYSTMYFFEG